MNGDNTGRKQGLAPAWKAGQSGNPAGRPKGARSKLGEAFLDAMLADFEQHGSDVIERVRDEKPEQYLRVVASLLPRDLNVTQDKYEHLSDAELVERIRQLEPALRSIIADESGLSDTAH